MEAPILHDKSNTPEDDMIFPLLGKTGTFWESIRKYLKDEYTDIEEVWKYYYEKPDGCCRSREKNEHFFGTRYLKVFSVSRSGLAI